MLILKGVTLHQNCAKCGLPQEVLILKTVKVVCFEPAVQVLILKGLECTETVQDGSCRIVERLEGLQVEGLRRSKERRKPERESRDPSWSVEFTGHGSAGVNACQG